MLTQTVFQALIVAIGVAGLAVSVYLHYQKKTTVEGMACPMDGSCEDVITSKYSKFLGFDVEMLGIAYYTTIIVAYVIFLLTPQVAPTWFVFGVMISSIGAVLFSAYLTYLQAFTLKMWCTWCVVSAILSTGILALAIPAATVGLTALMTSYSGLLIWGAIIGAAIGLGAALSYDALLLSSLKDFKITDEQANTLNLVNHLTWVALAAVVVSGIGLGLSDVYTLDNPLFLATGLITGTIILNDSFHSLYLSEKLIDISYSNQKDGDEKEPVSLRMYAMMFACISVFSWIALLTLKVVEPSLTLQTLVGFYLLGLAASGLSGITVSKVFDLRAKDSLPGWSPLH